jgi:hypothetical protein
VRFGREKFQTGGIKVRRTAGKGKSGRENENLRWWLSLRRKRSVHAKDAGDAKGAKEDAKGIERLPSLFVRLLRAFAPLA